MLISPFDTLSNVVAVHFPLYPTALMIKTELDNVSNAAFGKDVLIIHGTDDRIVPLQRGQTLFQQLPQKHKTFITINGRAHNDVLSTDQSWAEMESFVR